MAQRSLTEAQVSVFFHKFHNLDLPKKGWYGIRLQTAWHQSGRRGSPARALQYTAHEPRPGEPTVTWRIGDDDASYYSRPYAIRHARQDVALHEMLSFNLPFPQAGDAAVLKFDLLFSSFDAGPGPFLEGSGDRPGQFRASPVVASQSFLIPPQCFHSAHAFASVTFDALHFCQLDITVHSAILGFRQSHGVPQNPGAQYPAEVALPVAVALPFRSLAEAKGEEAGGRGGQSGAVSAQTQRENPADCAEGPGADAAADGASIGSSAADGASVPIGPIAPIGPDGPDGPDDLDRGGTGVVLHKPDSPAEDTEAQQRWKLLRQSIACLATVLSVVRSMRERESNQGSTEGGLLRRENDRDEETEHKEPMQTTNIVDVAELIRQQAAQWNEFHMLHRLHWLPVLQLLRREWLLSLPLQVSPAVDTHAMPASADALLGLTLGGPGVLPQGKAEEALELPAGTAPSSQAAADFVPWPLLDIRYTRQAQSAPPGLSQPILSQLVLCKEPPLNPLSPLQGHILNESTAVRPDGLGPSAPLGGHYGPIRENSQDGGREEAHALKSQDVGEMRGGLTEKKQPKNDTPEGKLGAESVDRPPPADLVPLLLLCPCLRERILAPLRASHPREPKQGLGVEFRALGSSCPPNRAGPEQALGSTSSTSSTAVTSSSEDRLAAESACGLGTDAPDGSDRGDSPGSPRVPAAGGAAPEGTDRGDGGSAGTSAAQGASSAEGAAAAAAVRKRLHGSLVGSSCSPQGSSLKEKHVVVFVHGYQGSNMDLRLWRNHFRVLDPDSIDTLMSDCNESCSSSDDIGTMARRLALETAKSLSSMFGTAQHPNRRHRLARLSFVGYSLGAVVIRAAISDPALQPYLPYLHLYVSISGPHLGYLYSSTSSVVSGGMWALKKLQSPTGVLHQLSLTDSPDMASAYMCRLAQDTTWHRFRHVVLISSPQDRFIPYHSARFEVPQQALLDPIKGRTCMAMADSALRDLMGSFGPEEPTSDGADGMGEATQEEAHEMESFTRCDVAFGGGQEPPRRSFNAMIGKAAHIGFLENDVFVGAFIKAHAAEL